MTAATMTKTSEYTITEAEVHYLLMSQYRYSANDVQRYVYDFRDAVSVVTKRFLELDAEKVTVCFHHTLKSDNFFDFAEIFEYMVRDAHSGFHMWDLDDDDHTVIMERDCRKPRFI